VATSDLHPTDGVAITFFPGSQSQLAEQAELVRKYMEHKQLSRQMAVAQERSRIDAKVLQETNDRFIAARQRVAAIKARKAAMQVLKRCEEKMLTRFLFVLSVIAIAKMLSRSARTLRFIFNEILAWRCFLARRFAFHPLPVTCVKKPLQQACTKKGRRAKLVNINSPRAAKVYSVVVWKKF